MIRPIFDYLFYVVCLTDNDVHEEDKNAIFVSMTSQRFGHVFFFFYFHPPHITPPPSCFAGGSMHVETYCLPFLRCTKTRWVKPKVLILDWSVPCVSWHKWISSACCFSLVVVYKQVLDHKGLSLSLLWTVNVPMYLRPEHCVAFIWLWLWDAELIPSSPLPSLGQTLCERLMDYAIALGDTFKVPAVFHTGWPSVLKVTISTVSTWLLGSYCYC